MEGKGGKERREGEEGSGREWGERERDSRKWLCSGLLDGVDWARVSVRSGHGHTHIFREISDGVFSLE